MRYSPICRILVSQKIKKSPFSPSGSLASSGLYTLVPHSIANGIPPPASPLVELKSDVAEITKSMAVSLSWVSWAGSNAPLHTRYGNICNLRRTNHQVMLSKRHTKLDPHRINWYATACPVSDDQLKDRTWDYRESTQSRRTHPCRGCFTRLLPNDELVLQTSAR